MLKYQVRKSTEFLTTTLPKLNSPAEIFPLNPEIFRTTTLMDTNSGDLLKTWSKS